MHAYLIIVKDKENTAKAIKLIENQHQASKLPFTINKIDDVRKLNQFVSLSIEKPTIIIIENFEQATIEAQNAFLKNLEEPQENLVYILTANSIHQVAPTITSRCQIVKTQSSQKSTNNENCLKFLSLKVGQRLAFIDKIKQRDEALVFTQDLIYQLHTNLTETENNYSFLNQQLAAAQKAFDGLDANGNVCLQLTNMVVNMA